MVNAMVIIPGIKPLAPSAIFTAFTNPTQNTNVNIHEIIALSSRKSRPAKPILCGISIGITAKHKPKINEIIINLILGLKKLLFKSSIKPILMQANIESQKALDIVDNGLGSITPEKIPKRYSANADPKIAAPPSREAPTVLIPCLSADSIA